MKALIVSLFLLGSAPPAATPALAPEALSAPPVSDDSPTAWACTVDTLREGKECVFESEATPGTPSPEQDAANRKLLKDISRALCTETVGNAREGVSDATLVAMCEKRYLAAADKCGLGGNVSIVDSKGRFAATARTCYRGLSTVLQEAQLMATVAAPCCACAARRGCPSAGDRCYADVAQQQTSPATLACLSERCEDVCSVVLPSTSTAPTARERAGSSRSGSASL
ncbi:hypothetical protein ACJ2CR_05550 [Myxococcus faecalis]|uniref:hypothetical protein n=1 Tax=Myxococcus faecalis TaxID=3115646 RepID=UPI0038D06E3A